MDKLKINYYRTKDGRDLGAEAGSDLDGILARDPDFSLYDGPTVKGETAEHAQSKGKPRDAAKDGDPKAK